MNRRRFLAGLTALPLACTAGRLYAIPQSLPKLLVVFLRGGYDAANFLVPVSSEFYFEARTNIAIPRAAALRLTAEWGLHPAVRDSLLPLYESAQAAFIPFAGTADLSRSHFKTQDTIEMGQDPERPSYQSGFLNRLARVVSGSKAIAFSEQLPLVLRGALQVPNVSVSRFQRSQLDAREEAALAQMYAGTPFAGQVREGLALRADVERERADEMLASGRNAVLPSGFVREARRIAGLMKTQYGIGFVDVGGWDTHVAQGAVAGNLAGRLEQLGRGLAAFAHEMGAHWQETVVVVLSEFGRTFRENGNSGTDHGHGSVYWVLGGSVRGGRIAGEHLYPARETLHQDRDYPVLNEYRALLAGLFRRMYGLSERQADLVFPGVVAKDFGLL